MGFDRPFGVGDVITWYMGVMLGQLTLCGPPGVNAEVGQGRVPKALHQKREQFMIALLASGGCTNGTPVTPETGNRHCFADIISLNRVIGFAGRALGCGPLKIPRRTLLEGSRFADGGVESARRVKKQFSQQVGAGPCMGPSNSSIGSCGWRSDSRRLRFARGRRG